jgi:phage gp36-like protein
VSYLAADQLMARVGGLDIYVRLTDDDQDETPDANVEAYLLGGTDATVDGYLVRGGYVTPLILTPQIAIVTVYALDIANYKAKTRGGRQASPDDVRAYEAALVWFDLLANKKLLLPGYLGGSGTAPALPVIDSDSQKMSRFQLRGL